MYGHSRADSNQNSDHPIPSSSLNHKQWLADFKILHISFPFLNISFHEVHFVGIDHNKLCHSLKRLIFKDVLQNPWE